MGVGESRGEKLEVIEGHSLEPKDELSTSTVRRSERLFCCRISSSDGALCCRGAVTRSPVKHRSVYCSSNERMSAKEWNAATPVGQDSEG